MPPFKSVTVYYGTYVNVKKRINEDDYWIRLFGRKNNLYFEVKYIETLEQTIRSQLKGSYLAEALNELRTIKINKLIPKQYSVYELSQKIKFFVNKEKKFPSILL